MRITGGTLCGRKVTAPRGAVSRPTGARTRKSLFDILSSASRFDFQNARIIDLFAGSGMLGFEALSRGGGMCAFIEIRKEPCRTIYRNAGALGLLDRVHVFRRSATAPGERRKTFDAPFTLALMDPPYHAGLAVPALDALRAGCWLAPGALVMIEQADGEPPARAEGFDEVLRRKSGAAETGFYMFKG